MLVPILDFIIGNSDRHQSNWAIIRNNNTYEMRFAPLYDNGSSLCSKIRENDIPYFFKDSNRMKALICSKSKSCIKVNNNKNTRHTDVIKYAIQKQYISIDLIMYIVDILEFIIDDLVNSYSKVISNQRQELISKFLKGKVKLLRLICEG